MRDMYFTLTPGDTLRWPNKCAYCGAPAEDQAPLSNTTATEYYGIAYKEEMLSLTYPICKKHKKICALLDWPASLGFITTVLISIFLPSLLLVGFWLLVTELTELKGEALSPFITISGYILYGGMIIYLVMTKVKKPIKIIRKGKNQFTLKFKSNKFFQEFKALNR